MKLKLQKLDKKVEVSSAEEMPVNAFVAVGPSISTATVLFYSKSSGVDLEQYPDGVFFSLHDDQPHYNAADLFNKTSGAENLKCWILLPTVLHLEPDTRPNS